MNNYVYLAGPISGLTYGEATDWREDVKAKVPDWVKTLSPLRSKQYLQEGDKKIVDHYPEHPMSTQRAINTRDYNDVKRSAAILVNFLGTTKVSIGTVMEIAWAKAFEIPVVLVMEKGNIHEHAMIMDSIGFVVNTLDEGIDIIAAVVGDDREVKEYFYKPGKRKTPTKETIKKNKNLK